MERFEHLSMVGFLILGLALVRLVTNMTSLLSKDIVAEELEDEYGILKAAHSESHFDVSNVSFYLPHTIFVIITFFTCIIFWWTYYPLNELDFFPDERWNIFTYFLFLTVPTLMFMLCEVVTPKNHYNFNVSMENYWYRYNKIILGLAWLIQFFLIINLLVFFNEPFLSQKVLGRVALLFLMAPMVFSKNKKLHEISIGIFAIGFTYTIFKYHIHA
jgi:hypothetical protein